MSGGWIQKAERESKAQPSTPLTHVPVAPQCSTSILYPTLLPSVGAGCLVKPEEAVGDGVSSPSPILVAFHQPGFFSSGMTVNTTPDRASFIRQVTQMTARLVPPHLGLQSQQRKEPAADQRPRVLLLPLSALAGPSPTPALETKTPGSDIYLGAHKPSLIGRLDKLPILFSLP
jgi:hypothetical protein